MRSNYKKLKPYIRQVDIRNTEGKTENLLGVSTQKVFIDSIANTVGTDFTLYRVVKRKQFVYVPDTSRRGDKIGIAMLEMHDEGLVSQAYTVFEIIDHDQLDPEYLMMWFCRPEFDRYARFKSHGSVREIFDWEEMGDVELPIPSIDKQREIVREYNTIVERIKLNEQLIQKLEETAQALYKQWFVDFEFPISKEYAESIGKPEFEGKPL
jgi:type I restriction enzyme S subunit